MNFSFRFLASLLVVAAFTLTSCGDDECVAPNVSENIIGSWMVTGGVSTVEFKSDGELIDPDDDLLGGEINGEILSEKSYTATNDSLFLEAVSPTNANNKIDAAFPIVTNECDAITISFIGINVVMTRQ